MITAVVGKPGAGKDLYMTWLMAQYAKADCLVASNIELKPGFPYPDRIVRLDDDAGEFPVFDVRTEEAPGYRKSVTGKLWYRAFWDFLGPGNWKIFLAELDNYFDSMDWASIPVEARIYWKQHRKMSHDVFYNVQSMENLFNRIRRQTQMFVLCENTARAHPWFKWLPSSLVRFNHFEFTSGDFEPDALVGSGYFSMSEAREIFDWYETKQIVGGLSHDRKGGGARVAVSGIGTGRA